MDNSQENNQGDPEKSSQNSDAFFSDIRAQIAYNKRHVRPIPYKTRVFFVVVVCLCE